GNGGLSRLAVTDDEFALAAADGDHAVNRLQPGGHGFTHGLAIAHAGSEALDIDELLGVDRTFIVDGLAEGVYDASDKRIANGHAHDPPGALDLMAFFQYGVVAEEHHADLVFFQVHGDAGNVVR